MTPSTQKAHVLRKHVRFFNAVPYKNFIKIALDAKQLERRVLACGVRR